MMSTKTGRGEERIPRRFLFIVIAMTASCAVLVGLGYYIASLFSGLIMIPRTRVEDFYECGELILPLDQEVITMQVSGGGDVLLVVIAGAARGNNLLALYDLEGGAAQGPFWQREISGFRARWVGTERRLAFEDGGDIWLLDLSAGEPAPVNLTSSEGFDENPLPSPRGDFILWTTSPPGSVATEFWCMLSNGREKGYLAPWQEMVAWSPAGDRVMSASPTVSQGAEGEAGYLLQEAKVGSSGWYYYLRSEEEVRCLWWPAIDELFFVAPRRLGEEGEMRAVWFKVEPSGRVLREASTDGLGADVSSYVFYPERGGKRIAYAGEKGLEILDMGREVISRYPGLEISPKILAWREAAEALLYPGPGGIYQLPLR